MSPASCAAWLLACMTTIACVQADPFHCDANEDCVSSAGMGWCEPTSYCSYADERCDSRRRYSPLAGPPTLASFWTDHACQVVTELDADRMIAAGDGVPIVPGPDYAWVYAFDRTNPTLGTVHSNEGEGSSWNAATHVDGEVLFGGRLGTASQSGKGVVAGLDEEDVPSQFAVFSDALWAVHALAPDEGGFVLGGFESTDGAPAAWVSAHTAAGAERWSWRPGHAEWPASHIEDVAVDGQGFTIAVGSVSDGSDQQRWIVRLDPQGEAIWSYALPNEMTGGTDTATAVVILPDDDIVVVGEAEVATGETDAWVARFSSAG